MVGDTIAEDIRLFVLNRIESIAHLEGLLLLRGNPHVEWSAAAVAQRLYISEQEAGAILARLCVDGFLIAREGNVSLYQYFPSSSSLRELVDRLADTYSKHLVLITNLIHAKPKRRVQEFADAFRFREDK